MIKITLEILRIGNLLYCFLLKAYTFLKYPSNNNSWNRLFLHIKFIFIKNFLNQSLLSKSSQKASHPNLFGCLLFLLSVNELAWQVVALHDVAPPVHFRKLVDRRDAAAENANSGASTPTLRFSAIGTL